MQYAFGTTESKDKLHNDELLAKRLKKWERWTDNRCNRYNQKEEKSGKTKGAHNKIQIET